jgi:hypothetical protein
MFDDDNNHKKCLILMLITILIIRAADRRGWIQFQVMVGLDHLSSNNQARIHRYFFNQFNLLHPIYDKSTFLHRDVYNTYKLELLIKMSSNLTRS